MQLGFVGLGKMGMNMVTRLTRGGHSIVAFDRSAEAVRHVAEVGASGVSSLEAVVQALAAPGDFFLPLQQIGAIHRGRPHAHAHLATRRLGSRFLDERKHLGSAELRDRDSSHAERGVASSHASDPVRARRIRRRMRE